mgnify:CR=1 FL=1
MKKTLFLLGGEGDIGSVIAQKFSGQDWHVVAPPKSELNLEDRAAIESYFSERTFDVDAIIQSAGINDPKPFAQVTYEDIEKTMAVNTVGFHRVLQYLVPVLKEKKEGSIVALSSIYGFLAREGRLPYVMSKHALNGLVKTLAIELGPWNIKVNSLSPGFVDTAMTRKNNSPDTIKDFEGRTALGRLASPQDIANVAYFLCSPENQYLTGQDIVVDGGYSIGSFQRSYSG